MLYPRLMLAKQLLKEDGVIFCSIDDRNQAYVKGLFDEVFGESNLVSCVVWNSINSVLKGAKNIRKEHEYILIYAKDETHLLFNKLASNMTFTNRDNDPKGAWFSSNAAAPNQNSDTNRFAIRLPNGSECVRNWKFSHDEFINGEVSLYFNGGNVPRLKIYQSECDINSSVMPSIFVDLGSITTAKKEIANIFNDKELFSTPKPIKLVKKIIEISSDKDSVIVDFFAGSGTTGQAVLEQNKDDGGNRQFILVTNNEITDQTPNGIAYDVTSKRLKRVMTGSCYDGSSDFDWVKNHTPYGDSLEVSEITSIASSDQKIFDAIDERLYGLDFKGDIKAKIKWICSEFELTCKRIEGE